MGKGLVYYYWAKMILDQESYLNINIVLHIFNYIFFYREGYQPKAPLLLSVKNYCIFLRTTLNSSLPCVFVFSSHFAPRHK